MGRVSIAGGYAWGWVPLLAGVMVVAILLQPLLFLVPLGALAGFLLIANKTFQVLWILLLPIFVLQTSSQPPKLLYGAGAVVVFVAGRKAIGAELRASRTYRQAFIATVGALALLAISNFFQVAGVLSVDGAQEALPYFLLTLPMLAPALQLPTRRQLMVMVLITVAAAASYLRVNLSYRGVATYGTSQGFSSLALVAACAATWTGKVERSQDKQLFWSLFIANVTVAAAVISGTRTALTLLIIPTLALLYLCLRPMALARVLIRLVPVLAIVAYIALAGVHYLVADPQFYERRYSSLQAALSGQNALGSDTSAQIRAIQYKLATGAIALNPLLGQGPNYQYENYSKPGTTTASLDTPLITLARVGYLGTFGLLSTVFAWMRYGISRLPSRALGRRNSSVIFFLFVIWAVVLTPIGSFLEDKGTGMGLLLILLATWKPVEVENPDAARDA